MWLVALLLAAAAASICTEACDKTSPRGEQTYVFCGTDGETHSATRAAVDFGACYSYCGVSVLYVGQCGCPNDCGNNGVCSPKGACVCNRGWGGMDCLSVACPDNSCSGHGACVSSAAGQDYCACDAGFTGPFCGQAVPGFRAPLWDGVIPRSRPEYAPGDPFGDAHPVLNLSAVGTMRITLDEDVFAGYLLYPFNLYNASYMPARMSFTNEAVQVWDVPIKWRVKGQSTRTNIKKAWDIKFSKHQPFFGLQKLAIKNGNGGSPAADSILKMMLESVALRGANVPVARTAFVMVYVNERLEGLYYFEETGDQKEFLESRFGTKEGNLMKLHWHVPLQYYGPDPQTYLDKKARGLCRFLALLTRLLLQEVVFDNFTTAYYRQSIGDGDISDFVAFLKFLNQSRTAPLDAQFDTDLFLRLAVVESFFIQDDNFCNGNNYYLFRRANSSVWTLFTHDYDSVFDPNQTGGSHNVYDYVLNYRNPAQDYNPARARAILNGNATFTRFYRLLLAAYFPPPGNALSLPAAYATFAKMMYPLYAVDRLQQMSYNEPPAAFAAAASDTVARMWLRAAAVRAQIQ